MAARKLAHFRSSLSKRTSAQLTPADVKRPHEPVGIAPLGLALDDEGLATDGELIVGTRIGDLACPYFEASGLGVNAGIAEVDDRVRAPCDHSHWDRLAVGRRVHCVDAERHERRVHRALEPRHQVRLPLISTRGRVQIGSGLDCTCSARAGRLCWHLRPFRQRTWSTRAGAPPGRPWRGRSP